MIAHRYAALSLALALVGCSDPKRDPQQWPISQQELQGGAPVTDDRADDGEVTYRRYCVGCHGSDGRGNGGVTGANLSAVGGPLDKPDTELITSVREGKRGKSATMPPHKPVLTDPQIAAVIGYVRRAFGPPLQPSAPAQPAEPAEPAARE